MKYMGSKNRHAKEILPIILKDRKENQWYVEPFVGGFNIIDKVANPRIAADSHYYLIELFRAIQSGWEPPDEISESTYNHTRITQTKLEPHFVGFVGFGCSYSGKWWGGYARGNTNDGRPRNYCLESKKNILAQRDKILGIDIRHSLYDELNIPENSIIYCDPPYEGTTKYKDKFAHKKFWEWCREKHKEGHQIFISEYNAPLDFTCVWQKSVYNTLTKDTGSKTGIEKLFTILS